MQTQIIFARKDQFPAEIPFCEWIDGDDATAIILVEDILDQEEARLCVSLTARDKFTERQNNAGKVSFQLHAGGIEHHAAQREAVRTIWPDAKELRTQFSHLSTDKVFQSIKGLTNSVARQTTVRSIVKGAHRTLVLEELDHVAAYLQMEMFQMPLSVDATIQAQQSAEKLYELLSNDEDNHARARNALAPDFDGDIHSKLAEIAEAYLG